MNRVERLIIYTLLAVMAVATFSNRGLVQAQRRPEEATFTKVTIEEAARRGTGPLAKLAAGINAFFGGLGVDKAFGKEGFYPEIEQSRQLLRIIQWKVMATLMLNPRGPIWEQKQIEELVPDPDKFWRDPRKEAMKIPVLRQILLQEKRLNLEAIVRAISPEMIDKLQFQNFKIDMVLELLGAGPIEERLAPEKRRR